ncbi:hypothetical protein K505DRAFT_116095 [Melanomma pulvis-pyrius CBS 109.77]|uniref:Uncharacterized protein n=1 Tax=Melanomma pulvis-pyrius CBS 109.77 TaxID=1314802 RepID=A0A6A6WVI2_9PLEO|nr:hypothetical protein K505DRAFT_116095 [Melanomma pulvis-pyrius CBS 109.77]
MLPRLRGRHSKQRGFAIAPAPASASPLCQPQPRPPSLVTAADSRSTVKEFFDWLVMEQLADDRDDYLRAQEVVVEQKWTIKDFREMANVGGELYKIAVGEPYRLKDGVVRHLRDDLRRYKEFYRATERRVGLRVGSRSGEQEGR